MTNPNLLTSEEAAEYVGVSLDFARRKLKHEVPYVQHKPGGPMRFWKRQLDSTPMTLPGSGGSPINGRRTATGVASREALAKKYPALRSR